MLSDTIEAKKVYYCNGFYTTDKNYYESVKDDSPDSEYYIEDEIEYINQYEGGMDEEEGELIEVNGIIYKFLGSYFDKEEEMQWGWVTLEEYPHYEYKCSDCGFWIHNESPNTWYYKDKPVCNYCYENEEYTFCEGCGEVFKKEDVFNEYYIVAPYSLKHDEDGIIVCKNCLKENNIKVDEKKFHIYNSDYTEQADKYLMRLYKKLRKVL